MYRCEHCGELFEVPNYDEWDIDDHYQTVDLCPKCDSEFITELPYEQADVLRRREKRVQSLAYYKKYPTRKPIGFDEKIAMQEVEDNVTEAEMRINGEWK